MTKDDLLALLDRATLLHERLSGHWIPQDDPANRQHAQARLERWCQVAAGGDWTRFARRLAWDGLDIDGARSLLGEGHLAERTELPAWAKILTDALDCQPVLDGSSIQAEAPVLVQNFLHVAQEQLAAASQNLAWLSTPAQQSLLRYLADQLNELAQPTLTYLSEQAEQTRQSGLSRLLVQIDPSMAQTDRKETANLEAICRAYPVLARQMSTCVLHWVAETTDFLDRLVADWPTLAGYTRASHPMAPGCVVDLRPGLSDSHQGGRTVWRMILWDGISVAYKPKNLTLDRAWNHLLAWCNQRGLSPRLGHLWTVVGQGYGWMQWADPQPLDATNSQLYAQRTGMVLGLLHLLHAADIHQENLITQAAHPLLIDAEMLRYPQVAGQEADDPLDVMRTGLLPRWLVNQTDSVIFGGLDGARLPARHHADVVNGYRTIGQFLTQTWEALTAQDGPLAPFQQAEVRFAPRPTHGYLRLLDHLRHPAFLGNGINVSIEADRLARTYLSRPEQEQFWSLLAAEHAALARGDVPLFTTEVGQPDLIHNESTIQKCLIWPALALPSATVQAQQQGLIRESLDCSRYLPEPSASDGLVWRQPQKSDILRCSQGVASGTVASEDARSSTPPKTLGVGGSFVDAACSLGELLAQRAVPVGNTDALTWIAVQHQPKSGLQQHGLLGDDLYAGRAGCALFLAGLGRLSGESEWGRLARAGLRTPRSIAALPHQSGRIYALSLAAQLLDAPTLLDEAVVLARETPAITAEGVLDGEAGLVLALLALHQGLIQAGAREALRAEVLEQARLGGDRLVARSLTAEEAGRLGGFSHGAAGVAHALIRLYAASGEARFRAGAEAAWDLQHSLFRDPPGNWQDLRGSQPIFLDNWCNGAGGIGLAAAASRSVLPDLDAVMARSVALLQTTPPPFLDTLCCGGMGQIESLLEIGLLLGREDWTRNAVVQAEHMMARASAEGSFRLHDELPAHLLNPSFFRGVAGIGYTLLRLAAVRGETQQLLPCVLRMAAMNT